MLLSRAGSEPLGAGTHLHLELVADVAAVELRAEQFELPVEQRRRVPVPVADQVQNLLVVSHGVHPCGDSHSYSSCSAKDWHPSHPRQILLPCFT